MNFFTRGILDRLGTITCSVIATLAVTESNSGPAKELTVQRLVVTGELIVSDTGVPWEKGFEAQEIPRGLYARPAADRPGGLWVRSRLIKGEIDDPFDDRFHALERDGRLRLAPGHISWNVWLDGAWRQMAIVQGEGLEPSEIPTEQWNGGTHPGRIRLQTYRPRHDEPLTDAIIGQGRMSIGGGGFGGDGLPTPSDVLHLWGGSLRQTPVPTPAPPVIVEDDGSGAHEYAILAVDPRGTHTPASNTTRSRGLARLRWDRVAGADAYVVVRDGREITGPLRIEGASKEWVDRAPR